MQADSRRFFKQQSRKRLVTLGIMTLLVLGAQALLQAQPLVFGPALVRGLGWFALQFMPNSSAWPALGEILAHLFKTVVIAVTATTVAAAAALGLALVGISETRFLRGPAFLVRVFASVMRNIPFVAWALVLLFSFKQTDFTGFLALFLMSWGYLTRAFLETLTDSAAGVQEALKTTGAGFLPIVFQGVLPACAAALLSWLLYMIENNIRDATLVGMLTGTGIGFTFDLYFKSFRYSTAGLVVLAIIAVTISIELVSAKLRQVLSA